YVSVTVGEGPSPTTSLTAMPKTVTVRAGEIFESDTNIALAHGNRAPVMRKITNPDIIADIVEATEFYANGVMDTCHSRWRMALCLARSL
ncbi:MAG: hypothetical protein RR989_09695, partial [Ruthenibacterium sp.]